MRITDVEFIELTCPLNKPIPFSLGTMTERYFARIRIHTSEGITGVGETSVNSPSWSLVERRATVEQGIRPLLLGENPLEIERLWEKMYRTLIRLGLQWGARGPIFQAISAADQALWDILGKATGQPVYRLLGGSGGEPIPLYATGLDVEDLSASAQEAIRDGYKGIRVRVGMHVRQDVLNVQQLAQAIGDQAALIVDANQGLEREEAVHFAKELGPALGLKGWLEEPIRLDDREGLRQLREQAPIRLGGGENAFGREVGKTFAEAKVETMRGVHLLRYYAGEGMRKLGETIPSASASSLMYTTRVPLGVVGIITPWNFPVAIPLWKLAPALIYGNTVVWKPASEAGVTAAKVTEVLHAAGFPPGVIHLLFGSGSVIGQGITEHPDISGISFTGSNRTGSLVARAAVDRGAKYQLEMGGKNPVIVLDDANLDLAVDLTLSGAMKSAGQKCTATSRVIVHTAVKEAFTRRLIAEAKKITVGNGMDDVYMGPLVSHTQLETVLHYIQKGKDEGARLLLGGERPQGERYQDGYFVLPTVFDGVKPDMTIAREEIFGPVLAIIEVSSSEEALEVANNVPYGLSASIFTQSITEILTFVGGIEAGMIRVNGETAGVELQAPFGGMKQSSSFSREQGTSAMEFYTHIQTVAISRDR